MFEIALISILALALAPPLYLLHQVSVLKKKINRALLVDANREFSHNQAAVQRELVQSFHVFDTLLASVQYWPDGLDDTARDFISTFRERAVAYVERGCEGSLLSTQLRDDRLKLLALQLLSKHRETSRQRAVISRDAIDNGDFTEYLKLLNELVQCHLGYMDGAKDERLSLSELRFAAV
ncbi:hypothetical protein [Microbulbifer halophilus]|uniref:Uncharacterized protein n=1 Tax=Microbulbifer halophilus TaxID=453963 RepID=A0ABW5EG70_9GAMM|nr:hypothetical protein [Microbulbifer halophilus]MCW8128011.1 hypothetical protein [Microbulbifer halophilus]